MSDSDKSVDLKKWAEGIARNMEMFKEGAEMMVRDHQKSNIKHSSFAIHLSHMSGRETSLPVQKALSSLSARIDGVEHERNKVLAQLQALIVNRFDKYPGQLAVQRASIETRNKAVKQYSRAHADYAAAKKNGDPKKIEVARGRLASEEQFMRSNEDVLNAGLGKFELDRVTEMKDFLGRYVQNEIFLHARAIEALTAAYADIAKIDPETEKAIFLRRIREMEFQDERRAVGMPQNVAPTPVSGAGMMPQQQSQMQLQTQMSQTQMGQLGATLQQGSMLQLQPPTPAGQFQPQYPMPSP